MADDPVNAFLRMIELGGRVNPSVRQAHRARRFVLDSVLVVSRRALRLGVGATASFALGLSLAHLAPPS